MWTPRGVMPLLLLTLAFSGCLQGDDRAIDPVHGEQDEAEEPGDATDPDDDLPQPWTYWLEHKGSVDSRACIDVLLCVFFHEGDETVQLDFNNATIIQLDLLVEWDEEGGTGEDRILTLECWEQEGGNCTGFPGPLETEGGSPLVLTKDDLRVPRDTTLNITVSLPNRVPEPLIWEHEEFYDFLLTGELLLDPSLDEGMDEGLD